VLAEPPVGTDPLTLPAEAVGLADPVAAELSGAVAANRRRHVAIVTVPAVVLFVLGIAIGTASSSVVVGLVIGAVLGLGLTATLLWGGRALVLRVLRAVLIDEDDVPGPATQVEGLCATMGLGVPALYLVEETTPTALVLGRNQRHAALVLTSGIVETLDPVALEGVLAHELSHIKRCDIAPATAGAALAILFGVGAQEVGSALHRVLGRGREFAADRHAVQVTRYPPGLRHALEVMASVPAQPGLASRRVGQITRWLFTVALPDRNGHPSAEDDLVGELDAASVRMAALDEW
jgi:heat shock protein HtpX